MEDLEKCGAIIPDTFYPVKKLQEFVELGTVKSYSRGSTVVLPGEEPNTLIYVLSGRLRVNLVFDDDRERLVYFAGNYTFVGRLFQTYNNIYVVAIEDSKVCFFNKEQLTRIFRRDEEVIFDVIRNYLSKVSYYMRQTAEMDYFNPAVRVVRLLYELAASKGVALDGSYEVDIDLSLRSISEITGTHYVTVSKVLGFLKRQNILEKKKNRIIIYDMEKLRILTQETSIFTRNQSQKLNKGYAIMFTFLACSKELFLYLS